VRIAIAADRVRGAGTTPNVLALSLRATSSAELGEILDAWFSVQPSAEPGDAANIEHLRHIEQDPGDGRRNRPA
jgi:ribose 5-phosphate isomerase B